MPKHLVVEAVWTSFLFKNCVYFEVVVGFGFRIRFRIQFGIRIRCRFGLCSWCSLTGESGIVELDAETQSLEIPNVISIYSEHIRLSTLFRLSK